MPECYRIIISFSNSLQCNVTVSELQYSHGAHLMYTGILVVCHVVILRGKLICLMSSFSYSTISAPCQYVISD